MGRAGRGGGGGGRSFSHSSSSRSHSSSRSYSSSSGRASRGYSSGGYSGGTFRPNHVHYRNTIYVGGGGPHYRSPRLTVSGIVCFIVTILIILVVLGTLVSASGSNIPSSTVNREPLSLGYGYRNDNVIDEIGWVANPSRLSRDLQQFYNETGVQPYIYLKSYTPGVTGADSTEWAYADKLYDELGLNEGCLLLVYFDTGDSTYDGASQMILGRQTESVMDSEAVEIFWAYYNQHFYSNEDEDTMFAGMFQDTAKRIMQRSTTGTDVMLRVVTLFVVVAVIVGVIVVMKLRRKHEAARAEETANILSQPLQRPEADEDPLLKKYSDEE